MAATRVKLLATLEAKSIVPTAPTSEAKEEMFFDAMKEVLSTDARLSVPATLKMMQSKVGPDTYYDAVSFVFRYMESSTGGLSRNETYALLVKLFRAYVGFIRGALRIPMTIKSFFNTMSCFDAAVESSYPGYREYGFLRAIIAPKVTVLESLNIEQKPLGVGLSGYIFDPGCF